MDTNAIIAIVGAAVTLLTTLGLGVKWLVSAIISSQEKATSAFTSSSEKLGHAITESSAAQVQATNSLRLEMREQRVEIRTLIGMQPPADTESSEDGEPAPLTPIRGVPTTPSTHLAVLRRGTEPRKP